MPRRGPKGELTRREADFMEVYVNTRDIAYAEHKAGYRPGCGWQALQRPEVQAAVEKMYDAMILEGSTTVTALLLNNLRKTNLSSTELQKTATHFLAAKRDITNARGPVGSQGGPDDEQSIADLEAEMRELQARAALRAKMIESKVDDAQIVPDGGIFE